MSVYKVCYLVCCFMLVESTNSGLSLTLSIFEPVEGSSVSLTCNYTDTTPIPTSSRWFVNTQSVGTIAYHLDTPCTGSLTLDNYTVYCASKDSHTFTILSVPLDLHNTTWHCQRGNLNSRSVILRITVPVKSLSFDIIGSNILTLRETDSKPISCTTSFCRPRANITWYIIDRTGSTKVYLADSTAIYNIDTDFISTISTLQVTLNRTYNEWKLVCEAKNIQGYDAASKFLMLNITYPTNQPTIQCIYNGIYKVVQNTTSKLTCSVDGGNPAGTLHWNCTGDITEYHGPNNNVTQTIVWTTTSTQYCTCTVTDIIGTRSISVMTEVLYPPVIDALQDKAEFEGESVSVQCVVLRANPPVSVIGWTSKRHNISGARLLIPNMSRTDNGMYRCTANNTIDPSCHAIVHGSTYRSLLVDVLYPPMVNIPHGKSFTFKEGEQFNYICPVEHGNPTSTNIMWRRSADSSTWNSSELTIQNVKRYDDGIYTCYAGNLMVNSNGIIRAGNVSADINLIVQFKTNVTYFYIRGYRHTISVMVMENTSLVFECHLHSNPISTVRLYKAEELVNTFIANMLLYYTRATCSGGPVTYSCHGNNSLSNQPSTRQLQLVVKCKPRADTNTSLQFIVASAINQTVSMSYTVLAYPPPSFVWYRNGSSIDISDPRTIVSSSNLQTNLTIIHVHKNDFGEYMLYIANDVGSIIELFHLKPEEHAVKSFADTTHNVSAIVGGLFGGLGILCGIAVFVFIYRRFVKHNQPESSTDQSLPPVTYENLKIEQIPKVPIEYQRDTSDNQPSDTSDNAYEGLSRQDGDKENQYTQLATSAMTAND